MSPEEMKRRSDESKIHCQDYDEETGEQIFLVSQERIKENDINYIMDRFLKDGITPPPPPEGVVYGDGTLMRTYEERKKFILEAEASFESLPAKIRKRFDNQPALFLEFMDDPENDEEAIRLGLKVDPNLKNEPSIEPPTSSKEGSENVPPAST